MKIKFISPIKLDKTRLYREALRQACIELVVEGNFDTYNKARAEMIQRAEQKIKEKTNHSINKTTTT